MDDGARSARLRARAQRVRRAAVFASLITLLRVAAAGPSPPTWSARVSQYGGGVRPGCNCGPGGRPKEGKGRHKRTCASTTAQPPTTPHRPGASGDGASARATGQKRKSESTWCSSSRAPSAAAAAHYFLWLSDVSSVKHLDLWIGEELERVLRKRDDDDAEMVDGGGDDETGGDGGGDATRRAATASSASAKPRRATAAAATATPRWTCSPSSSSASSASVTAATPRRATAVAATTAAT